MSEFDSNKVKEPTYFQENRLEAHSDHIYYASEEDYQIGRNQFRYSLNGLWKFCYALNYASSPKGFEALEVDCKSWNDICVPAHIQMEGYDIPQYVNVQYPWDGREEIHPGQIPERFNPIADYVKYFRVPQHMKGMPLFISFQGVESAMALWCNGDFVGYSEDSFTPSEFELTPFLKDGENKLAVTVFKWSSSSWCEDQDFFRFSGIFREVYLYTIPSVHIQDIKVNTLLDENFEEGKLNLDFKATAKGKVEIQLLWNGKVEKELTGILKSNSLTDKESLEKSLETENLSSFVFCIKHPMLWSAEAPNLYEVFIKVYDTDGNLMEVIGQKVGFRRFEMVNHIMCLNGKRIVFKGVNRHEFSAVSGRVVSEEELRKDLITMKRNNINAIRTCHYPNDSKIYALCDELGLYMIDECNLESHGVWEHILRTGGEIEEIVPGNRPEWHDMMLDRANSMYQRDKNHPSILIWSCGNEAFGGKTIFDMSEFFRSQDKGRLVQYEGVFQDRRYNNTSDIESQMYPSAEEIAAFLEKNKDKPFICCEYTHAMGNSCGGMHKYTDLTDTQPLYQGGFIWDYIDQSLWKKDRYGKWFQAYGGDFGDRPTDYNFSGNGIVYGGERKVSPKMQEVKYNYQNISVKITEEAIEITNKFLFTNTKEFSCEILLEKEGHMVEKQSGVVEVAPGCTKKFLNKIKLPKALGEYVITASFRLKKDTIWAKAGHEIAFGQAVFTQGKELITEIPICEKKPFTVIHGRHNLGVRGEEFEVLFSYGLGGMVSYRYGGKELLKTIPKPNFWRAPVDNDCGSDMMARYGQWKIASMYLSTKEIESPNPLVEESEDNVTITYTYRMPTMPVSYCSLKYQVFGDGTIGTTLSYEPVPELHDMPEFGVLFQMDADYENLEWYGNGPEETYSDRQEGAKLGIYRNKVADNLAAYLVPQECGNKTKVRYAKVTDRKGRGLLFAGKEMSFSALPYTPHELENAKHFYELPQVHYTTIRAAIAQMGIAGDNSWGAVPLPEYLLKIDKKMEFTFYFKGIV